MSASTCLPPNHRFDLNYFMSPVHSPPTIIYLRCSLLITCVKSYFCGQTPAPFFFLQIHYTVAAPAASPVTCSPQAGDIRNTCAVNYHINRPWNCPGLRLTPSHWPEALREEPRWGGGLIVSGLSGTFVRICQNLSRWNDVISSEFQLLKCLI